MMTSLFDQFITPTILWAIPLFPLIITITWLLIASLSSKWTYNRHASLQTWFFASVTKQLMTPLSPQTNKWAFLLTSLLLFLIGMNLLGLLPYTFTPTTQLSLNLSLAMPLWLTTVLVGLRNQLTASFAHLLPEGTPPPLIPILIIIETTSLFIRPLALGVRLTANLTAGHLLIHLISTATAFLLYLSPFWSLTFMTLILLLVLELAVAMIQAYVFVLLLSLYLQENT